MPISSNWQLTLLCASVGTATLAAFTAAPIHPIPSNARVPKFRGDRFGFFAILIEDANQFRTGKFAIHPRMVASKFARTHHRHRDALRRSRSFLFDSRICAFWFRPGGVKSLNRDAFGIGQRD